MWLPYRSDTLVCARSQRSTRCWQGATQLWSEHDPDGFSFSARNGRSTRLGRGCRCCCFRELLAPSLHSGQIVVMDNLSIHLGKRVRQAIQARGCQLLFLPAYSPDFSPIEGAFSKLKASLRRVGARTRDALFEAIAQALPTITPADALGWFTHCGYLPPPQPKQQTNRETKPLMAQSF